MNNINKMQNENNILLYLFTQRQLYSKAKRLDYILLALSIVFYILGLLPFIKNNYSGLVSVVSVAWVIISLLITDIVNSTRLNAAEYQEYIDRYLFGFAIDDDEIEDLNILKTKAIEVRVKHEKKYALDINPNYKRTVYNWYSNVSGLPLEIARIICQNENCRWESELRKRLNIILYCTLIAAFAVYIFFLKDQLFIGRLVSFINAGPIIVEIYKLIKQNNRIINICSGLEKRLSNSYEYINNHPKDYDDQYLLHESLAIQKKIFCYRQQNISVPDLVYKLLRSKSQRESTTYVKCLKEQIIKQITCI